MAWMSRIESNEASPNQFQIRLGCGETLLVTSVPRVQGAALSRLTRSEREVVDLALEGCRNAEIAQRRGTSVHTVANQLKAVFGKLGCSGRSELAALVVGAPSFTKVHE